MHQSSLNSCRKGFNQPLEVDQYTCDIVRLYEYVSFLDSLAEGFVVLSLLDFNILTYCSPQHPKEVKFPEVDHYSSGDLAFRIGIAVCSLTI